MDTHQKYKPYPRPVLTQRQWPDRAINKAPIWCSVDLRDGNQALAVPMNIAQKLELFELLVAIGFKQIEVGFPSASQTEFDFLRLLIDENRIPQDVTVQVLTQAREHLIARTMESLAGAHSAIVHLYNSTSTLQRKITFRDASQADIKEIACAGTRMIKERVPSLPDTRIQLQYSPESFSDTEAEFSLEVCQAVMDIWQPTPDNKIILNLPATVEYSGPHIYADQIEWFGQHLQHRELADISLHTHNDRGCGVAATELGLQAGADRVEGTLFGNGERTGNLDINIVALNMLTQGVDPQLDLSDLPAIRQVYERCTAMTVHERHPYAGDLVFTAFSGSHQDAIKKGMDRMNDEKNPDKTWAVPYLPIDPKDIGRTYEAIIRINSQSGKGGVAYILEENFGIEIPKKMHPEVGQLVNALADQSGQELAAEAIHDAFIQEYIQTTAPLQLLDYQISKDPSDLINPVRLQLSVSYQGQTHEVHNKGNGPINAFVHAVRPLFPEHFVLADFRQHAISQGSDSQSIAYICLKKTNDSSLVWGCALHTNIEEASLLAVVSACNRL